MLQRMWQRMMIGLARSPRMTDFMQGSRAGSALAGRYVAGADRAAAVTRVQALMEQHGIRSSLFFLGEYVEDPDLVAETVDQKIAAAQALGAAGLDVHISADPTQIGHLLAPDKLQEAARAIAHAVQMAAGNRPGLHALMLDMEDSSVTDATIALHDALRAEGLPAALTLQAYLRRTEADLARQIAAGSTVRLVKGAFAEAPGIAFTRPAEVRANWHKLIGMMLSRPAREAGFTPVIATHDHQLQEFARGVARDNGWAPGSYEFEMLLGVRGDLARALAAQGERVRLYAPFGRDWFPYAVRRIGENPRNGWLLGRSLLGAG
jgi:proline dehydrogenase